MSFNLAKTITPLAKGSLWKIFNCRTYVSRGKCAEYDDPKCSKETLAKKKPCASKLRRLEAKEELPKTGMWENPECCKDPCPDYAPRFDELYYASTDKLKRKYQQTWVSCPALQIKPKKLCIHEELKFAPLEKRSLKHKPKTACPVGGPKLCMDTKSGKCPRLKMPRCRGVLQPPKCKRERSPSHCAKECTPYPSYSECLRKERESPDPIECKCLEVPVMCEVWAEMRRRMTFVKG